MTTVYAIQTRFAIISPWLNFLLNHLWQSTVFAAAIGLLVLACRSNHARTRYWLWFAASLKLLIPFSILVSMGGEIGWPVPAKSAPSSLSVVMEGVSQPFVKLALPVASPATAHAAKALLPAILLAVWFIGCAGVMLFWWVRWRRVADSVRRSVPMPPGREWAALRRLQQVADVGHDIELVSSTDAPEPGVFGIRRPILLLPDGIADHLADAQLDAIIAHELCHVRRRDNLMAMIHMVIQAVFWFHPLVWWLGSRLVDERERACDEEVLQLGSEPEVYAEGILKVCEFYLESPIVCVAGVTGSNLKQRIEGIMTHRIANQLTLARKVMLATAGIAAVAGPVAIGVLNAPQVRAQSPTGEKAAPAFEVASIKPSQPGDNRVQIEIAPGGRYSTKNTSVKMLMQQAYGIRDFQISGGPTWISSDRYDIVAKGEPGQDVVPGSDPSKLMVRGLLADRFHLTFHKETKELPTYTLVAGKNGPKLQESEANSPGPQVRIGRGMVSGKSMSMAMLANQLGQQLGRSVIDKTGLTKSYDINLEWTPDQGERSGPPTGSESAPAVDAPGPSIFTALQEQLGLKLESQRGPVEIYIIDKIERPSEN